MLSEEEKKAIEIVKKIKNMKFKVTSSFYSSGTISLSIEEKEAIDTVLSLIKEQQEEIGSLQKELNEENKRSMILANNDKFKEQVIELMSELVYERFKPELLLEYGFESKEQFKQYFAELVRKE